MRALRWLCFVLAVGVLTLMTSLPGSGQDQDEPDYEATIAALQTQVAELGGGDEAASQNTAEATSTPNSPLLDIDPIPISDAFVVLYYYFGFSDGNLAVYGEMQNISEVGQLAPAVRFTFFDENGNSYGSDEAEPVSYWVNPGERMPFDWYSLLGGALAPGDWDSVEITAGDPASSYYRRDTSMLVIEDTPAEQPYGSVTGRIRNTGPTAVTGLTMYVSYFDQEGIYVGSCTSFSPSSDAVVPPGGAIRFEAGGGGCGNSYSALEARNVEAPVTQRLIIVRTEST